MLLVQDHTQINWRAGFKDSVALTPIIFQIEEMGIWNA